MQVPEEIASVRECKRAVRFAVIWKKLSVPVSMSMSVGH